MSKTVRKKSAEFAKAVASATNIRAYTLDNCFSGASVDALPSWIGDDFKLVRDGDKYTARVHSNMWFEFGVGA